MCDDSEGEADKQEDTNAEGLLTECILEAIDAVLGGGPIVDLSEIVEEAGLADTVAVEATLNIASELLETLREVGSLLLVVGVGVGCLGIKVLQVLVAVPEVIIGGSSCGESEGNQLCVAGGLLHSSIE